MTMLYSDQYQRGSVWTTGQCNRDIHVQENIERDARERRKLEAQKKEKEAGHDTV